MSGKRVVWSSLLVYIGISTGFVHDLNRNVFVPNNKIADLKCQVFYTMAFFFCSQNARLIFVLCCACEV